MPMSDSALPLPADRLIDPTLRHWVAKMLGVRTARSKDRSRSIYSLAWLPLISLTVFFAGCNNAIPGASPAPTVRISANPASVASGASATLTVVAANALQVTVTGTDGTSFTLPATGGTRSVKPTTNTTYTATATGPGGTASATATITMASNPPPTVNVSVSPASISMGGVSTLTVSASNATQVTVAGTDGSNYTFGATGGTKAVNPSVTTTYLATATGPGGKKSASATLTVIPPTVVTPTVAISANPTSIVSGSSTTLTVTATNAGQVTVTGTDGSKHSLAATGGTLTVNPTATTTYTATATGAGGTAASSNVTVTVVTPAPTVAITAKPASISAGSSSTLTVSAGNATQVTLTGSDGSTYPMQTNGGTQSVTPAKTTIYTATATGAGGKTVSATATVTVTPNPAATVTVALNPTAVAAGGSSVLTIKAKNATSVTVTGTDKSTYTLPPSGGIESVSPSATTTYTATAVGAGPNNTATATVTLAVTPDPKPTVTLTATPDSIMPGNSSTLTVTTSNATQVTITGTDKSTYTFTSASAVQSVSPAQTTTYTATATGPGGTNTATVTVTVVQTPVPKVTISANPTTISSGGSSLLTVTATNATTVTVSGSDGTTYNLPANGGTQSVSPTATTTTYTANATGPGGNAIPESVSVTVGTAGIDKISHVIFMMQENHTFDNYFGMLNPYRVANGYNVGDNGVTYNVDGISTKLTTISNSDDQGTVYPLFKFTTTCIDDESSAWLESYGDVNTYNFAATRPILMDGFVHNAEGFANSCNQPGAVCSGSFTDTTGERAMGYYDQKFLNYYYYMASQFALSDRWFTPMSDKSIDNRIATFTGGTTQGLVNDPGNDDHLPQLNIPTIFQELDGASVSWKIYYTVTQGFCIAGDDCNASGSSVYPATNFSALSYSYQYLYENPTGAACAAPTVGSKIVGDTSNSFCIDPNKIAPLNDPNYGYFNDLNNGTLPSFAFIEAGYGNNDEHPGSGQSILLGQAQVASIINAFMASPEWKDSVFFFGYDEGGGPYDHVPPVPGSSNMNTNITTLGTTPPDISTIAVNPDSYFPCVPPTPGTPTLHCDLTTSDPGANPTDAAAEQGFAAQLGFRIPNMIISPFTRRHYVSHIPMDHTAVIKFVENRFIGPSEHLTARDQAQPNLLDFFDFNAVPWATPPTPPTPVSLTDPSSPGYNTCTPANMGGP